MVTNSEIIKIILIKLSYEKKTKQNLSGWSEYFIIVKLCSIKWMYIYISNV